MKELSIEEKAKRYDEAIKRVEDIVGGKCQKPFVFTEGLFDYIFPELKESEDERIKACIKICLTNIDEQRFADFNTTLKECHDWLEKRGESNPYGGVSFKYNGHIWGMCARDNGVEILVDGEIKERVFLGSKPQGKSALEAINEEKVDNANKLDNTYKDGLWFHIGDWVVNNNTKIVFLIKSYNSGYYTLEDINGNTYSPCIAPTEKDYHLWTLKDARDGDILASKSGDKIFSYRGSLDLRGNPCAYYGIYKVHDGICFSPCAIGNSFTCEGVFPATKEQRKTLFEEMTAAKGVLHFNKKELKKIEQKEVIHNELTEFEKAIKQVMEEAIECGDTHNLKADAEMLLSLVHKSADKVKPRYSTGDVVCDKLCTTLNKDAQPNLEIVNIEDGVYICDKGSFPISQQDNYELVAKKIEQNPAWNNSLATYSVWVGGSEINDYYLTKDEAEKLADKYRKNGYDDVVVEEIEQKLAAWSEEDENLLELSFENLTELKDRYGEEYGKVGDCISWLKSLKNRVQPQSTWKPSDEQMDALENAIRCGEEESIGILSLLYNDLKKLKG